jgi:hypothetical protein
MLINAGYEITYECEHPTPMLLVLNIHPSRLPDLRSPQRLQFTPDIRAEDYTDGFGNTCTRIVAPPGRTTIATQFTIHDSGIPDTVAPEAIQHPVESLPTDTLVFLLGSRYCDTDHMTELAYRRSAITCTSASSSDIPTPVRPARLIKATVSAKACAVTSRISRSRSAAA